MNTTSYLSQTDERAKEIFSEIINGELQETARDKMINALSKYLVKQDREEKVSYYYFTKVRNKLKDIVKYMLDHEGKPYSKQKPFDDEDDSYDYELDELARRHRKYDYRIGLLKVHGF